MHDIDPRNAIKTKLNIINIVITLMILTTQMEERSQQVGVQREEMKTITELVGKLEQVGHHIIIIVIIIFIVIIIMSLSSSLSLASSSSHFDHCHDHDQNFSDHYNNFHDHQFHLDYCHDNCHDVHNDCHNDG